MPQASPGKRPSSPHPAYESWRAADTRLEQLSEGVIEAGWLVMLAMAPLFMNPYSARTYEPDKTALVRSIVLVMLAAWLWKVLSGGRAYVPVNGSEQLSEAQARPNWREVLGSLLRIPLVTPALVLAFSLVLGSILSVDPRLSWYGSYPRFQGAWTQLTYIVVFGLVLAHLRSGLQWRRISFVIIMTSFLVSFYALLQVLGLDPLPSAIGWSRAFSTLGNPIFLAAYLLMAIFVTVFEVLRFVSESRGQSGIENEAPQLRSRRRLGLAALVGVVILQITAVVLSQSRGPFLGLLAGGYVFALILALTLHGWARGQQGLTPGLNRLLRWAWLGIIALGVLGLLFLIVFTMPSSPLESLHGVPYLGRLGTILNFESNTAQVRLLIWQGVVELLSSGEPLREPDGAVDKLHAVRGWIGYGPETFSLAFNPHFPPALGQREGRGDVPDRAHNETFDALVMQGLIGYAAWLAIYCGMFYLCLRRLRMIRTRWQQLSFWLNLALGAALGAIAPYQLTGRWVLSGVGLPAGLIMGLIVYVTLEAVLDRTGRAEARPLGARDFLLMAVLATVVAHVVEVHFGIAIVSTRLYFWFLAAVAVCVSCDWLPLQSEPASVPDIESSSAKKSPKKAGKKKKKQQQVRSRGVRPSPEGEERWALFVGLILGLLGAAVSYGLSLNPERAARGWDVLMNGLLAKAGSGPPWMPGALLWLIVSLSVGVCLAWAFQGDSQRSRRSLSPAPLFVGLGLGGLYSLLQAGRAARIIRLQRDPLNLSEALSTFVNHVTVFVGFTLLMMLAIALSLAWRRDDLRPWSRTSSARALGLGLLLTVGSGWLITAANINPLRADTYLKHAKAFLDANRPELAMNALSLTTELDPLEPMNFLVQGRAAVQAAKAAESDDQRQSHFEVAEDALSRARQLAPLDPDHSANLARYFVSVADLTDDPARAQEFQERALGGYEAALALRPSSVLFINEHAFLLFRMGELEQAEELLESALELDSRYEVTLARLGMLHQQRASDAQQAGDRAEMTRQLEESVAFYERAVLVDPDLVGAVQALDQIRPVLYQYQKSLPSSERLRELYGEDWKTHHSMARLHLDEGRRDRALAHGNLAVELTPASSSSAADDLLRELRDSVPTARSPSLE